MLWRQFVIPMAGSKAFEMNRGGGFRRKLTCHAASLLCIALVSIPAFAKPPVHQNTASHHVWKDPATQGYTHNGLPCSTTPTNSASGPKTLGSQHRLGEIERRGMTTVRGTSERTNVPQYRPTTNHSTDRQRAIDFSYHASNVKATAATRGR
jgi:hypothetical protein